MPQLIAATLLRIGSSVMVPAASSLSTARRSAIHAPVIDAVRVPLGRALEVQRRHDAVGLGPGQVVEHAEHGRAADARRDEQQR